MVYDPDRLMAVGTPAALAVEHHRQAGEAGGRVSSLAAGNGLSLTATGEGGTGDVVVGLSLMAGQTVKGNATTVTGAPWDLTGPQLALILGLDTTYARLASPSLTGTPTAPTAPAADNSTQIATTAFVMAAIPPVVAAAIDRQIAELNRKIDALQAASTGSGSC